MYAILPTGGYPVKRASSFSIQSRRAVDRVLCSGKGETAVAL